MPKITINPSGQGIRQTRGKGLHHLSGGSKGFAYHVESGSLTALMTAGNTPVSGFVVPAGAVVTKIGLKIESPSVDGGTGSALANTISHILVGTTEFTLAAAINLVAASAGDIILYDLSPGATGISKVGAVDVLKQTAGGAIYFKKLPATKNLTILVRVLLSLSSISSLSSN